MSTGENVGEPAISIHRTAIKMVLLLWKQEQVVLQNAKARTPLQASSHSSQYLSKLLLKLRIVGP